MSKTLEDYAAARGKLREKALISDLYPYGKKSRVKSAPTPNKQTSGMSVGSNGQYAKNIEVYEKISKIKNESLVLFYIAELQYYNSCRVSELLNARCHDISSQCKIFLKASKNSSNRIIFSPSSLQYLLYCKNNNVDPFTCYDRYFIYRLYKRYGIELSKRFGSKNAVTHIFRYLAADAVNSDVNSVEKTQSQLGHKSKKSSEYYAAR